MTTTPNNKKTAARTGVGRSVAVLAGGTAIGQAITIVASPALARFYGPSAFGTLAVYTSAVSLLGGLAALSYHRAIPLPESDADAANVMGVSLIFTLLIAVITAVVVALVGDRLVRWVGTLELLAWIWMIPVGVLGLSCYEVLTQWAVRKKYFSAIATTSVTRGVAQTGTQLGFGLSSWGGSFGLLFGQLVGQWTGSGGLLRLAWKRDQGAVRAVTLSGMGAVLKRYRRFPQYTAPAMLLSALSSQAPPLLLAYYFGGVVTGLYALGARLLMMPVTLIAKAASQVFFASAPQAARDGSLGKDTTAMFSRMVRLGAPFALLIGIAAPDVFAVVFGSQWREAGTYTRWLAPWLLMVFVAFPLMPLVSVLERQRAGLVFQAILLAVRLGGLMVGGTLGQARLAIALFGVGSALCWIVYLAWLLRLAGARVWPLLRAASWTVLASVLWSAPIAIALALEASEIFVTIFSIATGGLILWQLTRPRHPPPEEA